MDSQPSQDCFHTSQRENKHPRNNLDHNRLFLSVGSYWLPTAHLKPSAPQTIYSVKQKSYAGALQAPHTFLSYLTLYMMGLLRSMQVPVLLLVLRSREWLYIHQGRWPGMAVGKMPTEPKAALTMIVLKKAALAMVVQKKKATLVMAVQKEVVLKKAFQEPASERRHSPAKAVRYQNHYTSRRNPQAPARQQPQPTTIC